MKRNNSFTYVATSLANLIHTCTMHDCVARPSLSQMLVRLKYIYKLVETVVEVEDSAKEIDNSSGLEEWLGREHSLFKDSERGDEGWEEKKEKVRGGEDMSGKSERHVKVDSGKQDTDAADNVSENAGESPRPSLHHSQPGTTHTSNSLSPHSPYLAPSSTILSPSSSSSSSPSVPIIPAFRFPHHVPALPGNIITGRTGGSRIGEREVHHYLRIYFFLTFATYITSKSLHCPLAR